MWGEGGAGGGLKHDVKVGRGFAGMGLGGCFGGVVAIFGGVGGCFMGLVSGLF